VSGLCARSRAIGYWFLTTGGVVLTLVTVTVPLGLVMIRIGATPRPVVIVDEVVSGAVVVVAPVTRRLPSGGFAARVGLGLAPEESVGVNVALVAGGVVVAVVVATPRLPNGGFAARVGLGLALDESVGVKVAFVAGNVAAVIAVGPAANCPGVVVMAAVVGVAKVLAAVTAEVVAVVAAAVVPTVAAAMKPPPPLSPLVITGVGSELMEALTVLSGLAVADGGMNWPVAGAFCGRICCAPAGLI
jgi:hypothetical protein